MLTLVVNIVLASFKLATGFLGNSAAMIADGVHTLSDVFTTIIVMISLWVSRQPADKEHPYGHGRAESIAAKVLSLALLTASFTTFKTGVVNLFNRTGPPSTITLYAASISIISQECMYHLTAWVGKKYNSQALSADAWHHRSDALSSVGTLIGIFAATRGLYFMDGVSALLVAILIFQMGISIWKKTVDELMDKQKDESIRKMIISICTEKDIVINENLLRLRHYGNSVYADMTMYACPKLTVFQSHELSETIRLCLINKITPLKDVLIHVEPLENEDSDLNSENAMCTNH